MSGVSETASLESHGRGAIGRRFGRPRLDTSVNWNAGDPRFGPVLTGIAKPCRFEFVEHSAPA